MFVPAGNQSAEQPGKVRNKIEPIAKRTTQTRVPYEAGGVDFSPMYQKLSPAM